MELRLKLLVFKTQFQERFNVNLIILVVLIKLWKRLLLALAFLVKQVIAIVNLFVLESYFKVQPLKMQMLILDLLLLLESYQEFFELYFQLDQQIFIIQRTVIFNRSKVQTLRQTIISLTLIFIHQTYLKLKLMPSFLTFLVFFEMLLIKLQLP